MRRNSKFQKIRGCDGPISAPLCLVAMGATGNSRPLHDGIDVPGASHHYVSECHDLVHDGAMLATSESHMHGGAGLPGLMQYGGTGMMVVGIDINDDAGVVAFAELERFTGQVGAAELNEARHAQVTDIVGRRWGSCQFGQSGFTPQTSDGEAAIRSRLVAGDCREKGGKRGDLFTATPCCTP